MGGREQAVPVHGVTGRWGVSPPQVGNPVGELGEVRDKDSDTNKEQVLKCLMKINSDN